MLAGAGCLACWCSHPLHARQHLSELPQCLVLPRLAVPRQTHMSGSDLSPAQQLNAAELLQEQGWQELFPGAGRDSGEGRPNPGPSLPKAVCVTWHETSERCLSSVSGSVCEPV